MTDRLHRLEPGDELIIQDAWGAIEYKGPGYFIAGGAGITPFISILRALHNENRLDGNTLFFSNKTTTDIIYEKELANMLGQQAVFVLTREEREGYQKAHINQEFIERNISDLHKNFYICGPDKMVQAVTRLLAKAGANSEALVFEK